MKSDIRDIVNDGVGDPHKDSAEIADAWFNEYDVQPSKKNNFETSDTRSIPGR